MEEKEIDLAGPVPVAKKAKDRFSGDIVHMNIRDFFSQANEVLGLEDKQMSEDDMLIMEYFIGSKELSFQNLSHEGVKSIYMYSPIEKRYVPFTFQVFAQLLSEQDYKVSYLEFLFKNLEFNIQTKMKQERDASFLYNIKFDNGTLIAKGDDVKWTNEKQLAFNNIHQNLTINKDTPNWIKKHKHYDKLMSYLKGISNKEYDYFISILASVFMPNSLSVAIFWILSEGGKGKSSFFSWFTDLIGGAENVSNLKIDDFIPKGNKPNYNLPFLDGKIMNLDDDYSGIPIHSSGFLNNSHLVRIEFK